VGTGGRDQSALGAWGRQGRPEPADDAAEKPQTSETAAKVFFNYARARKPTSDCAAGEREAGSACPGTSRAR
jgi:hypothetical protein